MIGKFRTDSGRLRERLGSAADRAFSGPRRWSYDLRRRWVVRVSEGRPLIHDEIAVLVIFQPDGVLDSTLFTLDWLQRQGVSPVVVSNLPLNPADRARLRARASLVIERPNLGYDFGGYREGVMTLAERGLRPRALYLLNDSVWFPLDASSPVLEQARADGSDLYALVRNDNRAEGSYLQTYFLRFCGDPLGRADFLGYWRRLLMVGRRDLVIRKIEWRLAKQFAGMGFSTGHMFSQDELIATLLALDDAALAEVARYLAETEPKNAGLLGPLLARAGDFATIRPQVEALIRSGKMRIRFLYAPPAVLRQMQVPFIKKARRPRGRVQRNWLRRHGLIDDLAQPVRAEIAAWDGPAGSGR